MSRAKKATVAQQWWEILEIPEASTVEEIRKAYRALALRHHPDVGGCARDFKRIKAAYDEGLVVRG